MKNIPTGSVQIHLSNKDMGNFVTHPLFQQTASTAVQVRHTQHGWLRGSDRLGLGLGGWRAGTEGEAVGRHDHQLSITLHTLSWGSGSRKRVVRVCVWGGGGMGRCHVVG